MAHRYNNFDSKFRLPNSIQDFQTRCFPTFELDSNISAFRLSNSIRTSPLSDFRTRFDLRFPTFELDSNISAFRLSNSIRTSPLSDFRTRFDLGFPTFELDSISAFRLSNSIRSRLSDFQTRLRSSTLDFQTRFANINQVNKTRCGCIAHAHNFDLCCHVLALLYTTRLFRRTSLPLVTTSFYVATTYLFFATTFLFSFCCACHGEDEVD